MLRANRYFVACWIGMENPPRGPASPLSKWITWRHGGPSGGHSCRDAETSEESRRLRAQNDQLVEQYAELKREFDRLIRKKPATNQSSTLQGRDEEDP